MKAAKILDETGYLSFFGLHSNPFPVAPDDDNFYISSNIDQILTEIIHGIITRKGFMVLDGDVGLGKTTIARRILNILESKGIQTSLVLYTAYREIELLREINRDFGLTSNSIAFGDLMEQLKSTYTIVIVTHNMQQAARVSERTAFFYMGELIEYSLTSKIFSNPGKKQTEDYVTGRFG